MEDSYFDDIRSYRDHEIPEVIDRLREHPEVSLLLSNLIDNFSEEEFEKTLQKLHSIRDFQHHIIYPIFIGNIQPTFSELTMSGLENLSPDKAYLFISNHRDIVLDSAILNYFLHHHGFPTAEIAIGDNLLKEEWIEDLVRLNKSFVVRRGLDNAEMLMASKKLSAYITDSINRRNQSVWIAQRAGRAKDGNDETNRGLITMFGMSAENDLLEHYISLNIVPVSVSYEIDPCDERKTHELYREMKDGEYVKGEMEDVESMKMGIVLPKGKGHMHFGEPINQKLREFNNPDDKKATLINSICEFIDEDIQSNYKVWSSNETAMKLLSNPDFLNSDHSEDENQFIQRMQEAISRLDGDSEELKNIFLGMYQQPLLNKRKHDNSASFIP